jgi:hypothetical protein
MGFRLQEGGTALNRVNVVKVFNKEEACGT